MARQILMHQYSGANPDVICSTHDVPVMTVREVLRNYAIDENIRKFCIPVFQRRYCWDEVQLKKFTHDIISVCALPPPVNMLAIGSCFGGRLHDLGRIVVWEDPKGNYVVIDGQQRLLTICIMLSAIRDFLLNFTLSSVGATSYVEELISVCDSALLTRSGDFHLEPSHFDRESYMYYVSTDSSLKQYLCNGDGNYIIRARLFFSSLLQDDKLLGTVARKTMCCDHASSMSEKVRISATASLIAAILDKLSMHLFVVRESDIQSVYERLAMREALVSASTANYAPGVSMVECDLVRNFVTSFFSNCSAKIEAYLTLWIPIENAVQIAVGRVEKRQSDVRTTVYAELGATTSVCRTTIMEAKHMSSNDSHVSLERNLQMDELLYCFVESRTPPVPAAGNAELGENPVSASDQPDPSPRITDLWLDPGADFFPTYAAVKTCVHDALRRRGLCIVPGVPSPAAEDTVRELLSELLLFVQRYTSSSTSSANSTTPASCKPMPEKGKCSDEKQERGADIFEAAGGLKYESRHGSGNGAFLDADGERQSSGSDHATVYPGRRSVNRHGCQSTAQTSGFPSTRPSSRTYNPGDGGVGVCVCISRGTLCTQCIIKKYAK